MTIKKTDILNYLNKIIFKKKKIKNFKKIDIFSNRELDSMSILKIIILIESKFKIRFSDSDIGIKNFNTIEKISKTIIKKLKK